MQKNNKKDTEQCAIPVRRSTYVLDKYEGHDNDAIISLINELNVGEAEIERIKKEIEEIQNNCVHIYMFVARYIHS